METVKKKRGRPKKV
jgi:hypothetical protein